MEALWNYFYWQTLSINMLDDTSHMLGASLPPRRTASTSTPRRRRGRPDDLRALRAYLVRTSRASSFDPLDDGKNPSGRPARPRAAPADEIGEQRGEGQPEAGPLQPARPVTAAGHAAARARGAARLAPPDQQQLPLDPGELENLTPEELQNRIEEVARPCIEPDTTGQLLDFLLAP